MGRDWTKFKQSIALTSIFAIAAHGTSALAASCEMEKIEKHHNIYASSTGVAALYYRAKLDVNTDGASRSYHPDDPKGESLALNNIANAITRIYNAKGKNIDCSPRQNACYVRYIKTFEAARDAKYNPVGHPRIKTDSIIPWQLDPTLGRKAPCRISSGPNKGYFVSETALSVDPDKDDCDQGKYLDSLIFKAVVIPGSVHWKAQGTTIGIGDLVVVRDMTSGTIFYAINGDSGPATSIGEGSVALAAALGGKTLTGHENYHEIKALARSDVQYLTFPKDDIRRVVGMKFTQADIDTAGADLFRRWGGVERLKACESLK
jgi:hypothetical protein